MRRVFPSAALVCAALAMVYMSRAVAAQGGCSAAARDFFAMTFCSECDVVNGVPVATNRPTRRINQTCVSPCIQAIPRPCIYLERPWLLGGLDAFGNDRSTDPHQEQNFLRAVCTYTRTETECTSNVSRIQPRWSPFETACPDYGGTLVSSGQTAFPFGPANKTLVPGAIPYCRAGDYIFLAIAPADPLVYPFCYAPQVASQTRPVRAPLGVTEYDFYITCNSTDINKQFARIAFDIEFDFASPPASSVIVGVVCLSNDTLELDSFDCSNNAEFLHAFPGIPSPTWNDALVGAIMPFRSTDMVRVSGPLTKAALAPADELRAFFPFAPVKRTHQPSLYPVRTAYGVAQESGRVLNQPTATGLCAGLRCVASPTNINGLASVNPDNDPCAASSCAARLTDAALALDSFDPATPSLWPSPACTPISPGFPRCTSFNTSYPSLQFALTYIVAANLTGALRAGDACDPGSSCVSEAFCFNGRCTPSKTATASCELFTCRECSPYGGTCTGSSVIAGSTCYRGCLDQDQGTCTATQTCEGNPITGAGCAASQGIFLPNITNNGDCYIANCLVLPTFMETNRTTFIAPQYGVTNVPVTFEAAAAILQDILQGTGGLTECTLSYALSGDPCNDQNACTNSTQCDGLGTCFTLTSFDFWCQSTACRLCNPATGLCTGSTAPEFFPCVTGCGTGPSFGGFCGGGTCDPSEPNSNACFDFSSQGYCNTSQCSSIALGNRVAIVPFTILSQDTLVLLANLTTSCNQTRLPDGDVCFAASFAGDRCVVQEFCLAGQCSNIERFNCTEAIAGSSQCGNSSTAKCNPATGACEALPLQNGTACNDGNLCTIGDACFAFPSFPDIGVCVPGPALTCSTGGNPCIESAQCDPLTGACVLTPAPNGLICSLGVPMTGVCPQNGTCSGGLCLPPGGTCPALNAVCAAAGCNTTTGNCTVLNRPDGIGCDDGNKCTTFDVCTNGTCAGVTISCLPLPSDCFVLGIPACASVLPGSGCNYAPLPVGTTCQSGRGRCDSTGTCVCQRVCLQGTCVYEALNGTSCACFPDYTGANCEIFAPIATSSSITDFIDDVVESVSDFATDNLKYATLALVAIFTLALTCVTLCTPRPQTIRVPYYASASDAAFKEVAGATPAN